MAAELTLRWREDSTRWLRADPDLGYKLNAEVDGVNSLGIRNREELEPYVRGERFRVLVIGDSVAADPDGFVRLLHEQLNAEWEHPIEVVNAAIPGYTTYQQRVFLERDLEPLGADLVLLQYCLNDNYKFLHRIEEGGRWVIISHHPDAQRSQSAWAVWSNQSALLRRVTRRLRAGNRVRMEQTRFPWEQNEFRAAWRDNTWPDQEEHLRAIRDTARRMGAGFAIVTVPYEPQLDEEALATDRAYTLYPQRKLIAIAERLRVPHLDLHSSFLRERKRPLYTDKIHLTDGGHAIVASELSTFLHREGLLHGPRTAAEGAGPRATTQHPVR